MPHYSIFDKTDGAFLGIYKAGSKKDAIRSMYVDVGYASLKDAADSLGIDARSEMIDDLIVIAATSHHAGSGSQSVNA
ncbi:MAG: hypothetical protein HQM00_10035 [Magnetococcales bacterium]|nr:hypothetical protein [Magnetococcales bacterium]